MGGRGCHVIFRVEGDVLTPLKLLGYLLGAVNRDVKSELSQLK